MTGMRIDQCNYVDPRSVCLHEKDENRLVQLFRLEVGCVYMCRAEDRLVHVHVCRFEVGCVYMKG